MHYYYYKTINILWIHILSFVIYRKFSLFSECYKKCPLLEPYTCMVLNFSSSETKSLNCINNMDYYFSFVSSKCKLYTLYDWNLYSWLKNEAEVWNGYLSKRFAMSFCNFLEQFIISNIIGPPHGPWCPQRRVCSYDYSFWLAIFSQLFLLPTRIHLNLFDGT